MPKRSTVKLTKSVADKAKKAGFVWDAEIPGFGLRVHPSGARAWCVQYMLDGRTKRHSLGSYPKITAENARAHAARLLVEVRLDGRDPSREKRERLDALTVAELVERYEAEHLPKNARATQLENKRILAKYVTPALGPMKVAAVTPSDVQHVHASLATKPVQANRVLFLISTLFNLAERWGLRPDGTNPTRRVERFAEAPRERHLSELELRRLGKGLKAVETSDPAKCAAIRLLVLTGCRRAEILGLEWARVDLERGFIALDTHKTARHHGAKHVVLNEPALDVLRSLANAPKRHERWVFPNPTKKAALREIRAAWNDVKTKGGLDAAIRLHDLRHSFASQGLLEGLSLPAIGALLGHSRATTTQRYAHWSQDPLREASAKVGERIGGALEREVAE